ncbi:hypothetical protein PR048_005658 [Dryococelus australis]|uniref:Uncharacterized protein n=1 Tax=Dryococelus australis TaxID=614101 RepID=A0ABQ9I8V3_9NEOP|nr:hypothetical protein PR048_005658 [Dryococelus australis]
MLQMIKITDEYQKEGRTKEMLSQVLEFVTNELSIRSASIHLEYLSQACITVLNIVKLPQLGRRTVFTAGQESSIANHPNMFANMIYSLSLIDRRVAFE